MNFARKRILVTGGTNGIGREVVQQLAAEGAQVFTCGRSQERLRALTGHPNIHGVAIDLAEASAPAELVRHAVGHLGGLDVVIACAGIQDSFNFIGGDEEAANERIQREISTNFTSVVLLAAASMPALGSSGGAFVAVTSGLAYAPKKTAPVYCATKAGLRIFLEALRYQSEDLAPRTTVQEVVLPVVATDMTAGRNDGEMSPDVAAAAILRGLQRRTSRIVIGKARILLPLMRIAPGFGRRILRNS